mmetsp:Transcript_10079/g.25196  ORF Transcript_10079/g.25196 Transcript_10079/m.25196 type:complete len:285 (+) Transcript_10079:2337-3191(+)
MNHSRHGITSSHVLLRDAGNHTLFALFGINILARPLPNSSTDTLGEGSVTALPVLVQSIKGSSSIVVHNFVIAKGHRLGVNISAPGHGPHVRRSLRGSSLALVGISLGKSRLVGSTNGTWCNHTFVVTSGWSHVGIFRGNSSSHSCGRRCSASTTGSSFEGPTNKSLTGHFVSATVRHAGDHHGCRLDGASGSFLDTPSSELGGLGAAFLSHNERAILLGSTPCLHRSLGPSISTEFHTGGARPLIRKRAACPNSRRSGSLLQVSSSFLPNVVGAESLDLFGSG